MGEMQAALGHLAQVEARIQAAGSSASEQLYNAQQAALSKCRQLSADAKEAGVMAFIRTKLREQPERKLLLFAHHKSMLHMVCYSLNSSCSTVCRMQLYIVELTNHCVARPSG